MSVSNGARHFGMFRPVRTRCQRTRSLTKLVNPNCYEAGGSHGGAISSRTALILSS
jgi:hypothetical protein